MTTSPLPVTQAETVLPAPDLDGTIAFFTDRLGFRLDMIMPADDPSVATLDGPGVRVRLDRDGGGAPGRLRLAVDGDGDGGSLTAPNGTLIDIVPSTSPLVVPALVEAFEVSRPAEDDDVVGRAGMRYRDLLPSRLGGRFIASHIEIPEGGPVPDYVHYHRVRFQMIYCAAGWVKVVYEGQGEPFVLQAGDCVLQPPEIRHRVLESSPGMEVVEIGCPAEHETRAEHTITLPTQTLEPGREWSGQQFVRHVSADAAWTPWRAEGFEYRDTGIGAATAGLAGAVVVRPGPGVDGADDLRHAGELQWWFVLRGAGELRAAGHDPVPLSRGVSVAVPSGTAHSLSACSDDLELLEVTLPG